MKYPDWSKATVIRNSETWTYTVENDGYYIFCSSGGTSRGSIAVNDIGMTFGGNHGNGWVTSDYNFAILKKGDYVTANKYVLDPSGSSSVLIYVPFKK